MEYNPPVGIDEFILRHIIMSRYSYWKIFDSPAYELERFKKCVKAQHRQSNSSYRYYKALEDPKRGAQVFSQVITRWLSFAWVNIIRDRLFA